MHPDKYIHLKIIKDFIHHVIMLKKDDLGLKIEIISVSWDFVTALVMNDVALLKSPSLQGHFFFFNLSVFSGCLLMQLKENHLKK